LSNVGIYAITQGTLTAGAAGDNYMVTFVNGTLTINRRSITVTPDAGQEGYAGQLPTNLTYTVGGQELVGGDTLHGALTTAITPMSQPGDFPILQGTVTNDNNPNYDITFIDEVVFLLNTHPDVLREQERQRQEQLDRERAEQAERDRQSQLERERAEQAERAERERQEQAEREKHGLSISEKHFAFDKQYTKSVFWLTVYVAIVTTIAAIPVVVLFVRWIAKLFS
jgi:hypothetical protein